MPSDSELLVHEQAFDSKSPESDQDKTQIQESMNNKESEQISLDILNADKPSDDIVEKKPRKSRKESEPEEKEVKVTRKRKSKTQAENTKSDAAGKLKRSEPQSKSNEELFNLASQYILNNLTQSSQNDEQLSEKSLEDSSQVSDSQQAQNKISTGVEKDLTENQTQETQKQNDNNELPEQAKDTVKTDQSEDGKLASSDIDLSATEQSSVEQSKSDAPQDIVSADLKPSILEQTRTLAKRNRRTAQKQASNQQGEKTAEQKIESTEASEAPTKNQQRSNGKEKRRNKREPLQPQLSKEELATWKVTALREKARELELEVAGIKKPDLIEAVYTAAAEKEGFRTVVGILDIAADGFGFIRPNNYIGGKDDAFVVQHIIKQYGLRPGDEIEAQTIKPRSNSQLPPVQVILKVNGLSPEEMLKRPRFKNLTPIYPDERLVMEHGRDSITGRAIDIVAPIGKGQRGLIVSPPKAGKTTILKKICQSIAINNPEVHLICLLVDERPEEVTDMQRSIKGEVVASTFDMPAENHTQIAELVIERAKRLVELGRDVVVVLDSITRLARAYNTALPASGRILSGGVDSQALYPPKRFLGAARNIEHGGSLTILASALIETGSKMDEVIFEEFKGTGNMELKLDRDLADKRIYPAIDPVASGTRNESLLLDELTRQFIWGLRRTLAGINNVERAQTMLIRGLKETRNNQEFLIRTAKKSQLSEYKE